MATIKFDKVVSVNSETQGHSAQNLLNPEVSLQKSWLCEKGTDKAIVILQLERAAVISAIHVGNAHSAFVEVLAGRASDASDQYESLLPMSTFMNPNESKTSKNPNQVRFFSKDDLDEKTAKKQWDRIKIVCSQPFNKLVPYGLCFVEVKGEKEGGSEGNKALPLPMLKKDEDTIEIGSFFRRKKESQEGTRQELSVSEQIREAEKPEALSKHTPISTSKLSAKMSEKHSDRSKRKTSTKRKEKAKDEDNDDEELDNRKNPDLGLEDEYSTPKKPKLDSKKEQDSGKKKTEPKKEKGKKKKETETKPKLKKPFNKLLEDVVFVISGFKNPLRGDIRAKAMELGAKYSGDWDSKCTHLICAYDNTPKFNQVKGTGKIVKKEWIEKCHEDRRRYPWRKYALDEDDRKRNESEDEIIADDDSPSEPGDDIPSSSNVVTRDEGKRTPLKQGSGEAKYDLATDDEEDKKEDTTSYPMPFLPDVFSMKTFYVDNNIPNRATIERYIIAYNGIITESLNNDVDYYITDTGGPSLEIFHKKAPNFIAVKPSWIWEINSKQQWIPTSQFLVK